MWGFIAAMGAAELVRLARARRRRGRSRGSATAISRTSRARAWADVALDDRADIDPEVRHRAVAMLAERQLRQRAARLGAAAASRPRAARADASRAISTTARSRCWSRHRRHLRAAARVERPQRQPVDPRRGLGAVQLRRLPEPARVARVPVAHRDDGQAAAGPRALGGRRRRSATTAPRSSLELLPYFTNGRIDSMEGLYFESSATTSFHFLTVSELAQVTVEPGARARVRHVHQRRRLRARREAPPDARRQLPDAVLAADRRRWRPTSPT